MSRVTVVPIIEALEPRILYSADLPGAGLDAPATDDPLAAALSDAVSDLELSAPALPAGLPPDAGSPTAEAADAWRVRHELVVVDTGIDDYETLLDALLGQSDAAVKREFVLVDGSSGGLEQVTQALEGLRDLDAIHLLSHGRDGAIGLGSDLVDTEALRRASTTVAAWGEALAEDADILVYGCDLATSADGRAFADTLAALTGADVAASDDLTGSTHLGGDWDLEYATGTVETGSPADAGPAWSGALELRTFQEGASGYTGTQDTRVTEDSPTADQGGDTSIRVDFAAGTVDQGLIRFDGLFGTGPGQIPFGSTIDSATLTVEVTNESAPGATIALHRMLTSWTEGSTWGSTGSGIQLDDAEASAAAASVLAGPEDLGPKTFTGLESSVQAWADGAPNLGWVIVSDSSNGWVVDTSESAGAAQRPALSVEYTAPAERLWISTDSNVAAPGADGLPGGWSEGEVLRFGGTDLAHGDASDGDLSRVLDFDDFALDPVDAGALHFVGRDLTVGGAGGTFDLEAGDVLVSFLQDETVAGAYTVSGTDTSFDDQDLLVFRPDTVGNYGSGTFHLLLDDVVGDDLKGVTLVEEATTVGGTPLGAGSFLLIEEASATTSIDQFVPTGVGEGTTAGTTTPLIDIGDLGIAANALRGIELVESVTTIGGQTFAAGSLLATLNVDDPDGLAGNALVVDKQDVFVLDLTSTGLGTTAGTASMLLDGSDVNLDGTPGQESAYALALGDYWELVVDTVSDVSDGDVTSVSALLSDKGADGQISLREAIEATNATSGGAVPDVVHFGIGSGLQTIDVGAGGLPGVTDALVLDATTQPGYAGTPLIQLDGSAATGATAGIVLLSNDSTVQGFIVHSFPDEGIEIDGSTGFGDDNVVRSNWVGIDDTGAVRGNADYGVMVTHGARGNTIGGSGVDDGNVVGGSASAGVVIRQAGSDDNVVQGNLIGVGPDGTTPIGNATHGVEILSGAAGNLVGGTAPEDANTIAHNAGDGVFLASTAGAANAILGNSLADNDGLAINLDGGTQDSFGVTATDGGDGDSGPNDLLNHPVFTSASYSGGDTTLDYDLDLPAGSYRVEFFSTPLADPSGHGEAAVLLFAGSITHTGGGPESFSSTFAVARDTLIVATVTEDLGGGSFGSTSELSQVTAADATATFTYQDGVGGFAGTEDTELRSEAPDTALGSAGVVNVDVDAGPGSHGALIRFGNILGTGPGQVPPGSTIVSATITLEIANASDPSAGIALHRMLVDWTEASTWNSLTGGVQLDDVEARATADGTLATPDTMGTVAFTGLQAAVQGWVDGDPNYGWAIDSDSSNGWDFLTSEDGTPSLRPKLTVEFLDTTAPTVTVTSASTTDTTPALSGTVDDNAATISVVVDGNTYAATNHGDGTWTLADDAIAPALADGTYDVAVTATDALGNAGTDASANELTVDTTAPTVTVTSASTTDTTPALSGTVDDNAATISVVVDGNTYAATNHGDGTWTLADDAIAPALADGTYDVAVTATDALGNAGTDASSNELTVDTTAPTVTVTSASTTDTTPALSGTVDDNAATISVVVDGNTYAATNHGDGTWTLADDAIAPALADGTYDVAVTATDALGNAGTDASANELTVDTTAPTVTVTSASTTDTTPALSGTVDDNAATISVVVDGNTYAATNHGDGTWTLADDAIAPALADGTYDVAVTATDALGNAGTDASANELTVDTTAPTVTVTSASTTDTTPALSGTVDDNAATISVVVDGNTYAATNHGDGTWTLADDAIAPALADGTYDVAVTATDALGNAGTDASANELTVDTTAPTVTVTSASTTDTTPALSGTVDDNAATISVVVDGNTYAATNHGDGTWTLADDAIAPALADGTYDVAVTATDALGNAGTDASANELTVDTTAPTVTVTSASTTDTTPALSGTVDDNAATISVVVDGNTYAATNHGDGTWTLADDAIAPALADGTYDVAVTATDALGNAGTDASANELTVDTTAPTVTVTSASTTDTTPALSGTVDDNAATISVVVDGNTYAATNHGDGTWTLADDAIAPALADGTYDVAVTATDALGNAGTDASANELTVDTTAPTVTVTSASTTDTTPALSGTVDDNAATISVVVDGNTYAATNHGDGTWTLADDAIAPALADGTYDVAVTATDALGNAGTDASANELTVDTTAPTVTVTSASTTDTTPALSGTVDDNAATISVVVDGNTYAATNHGDGTWTLADDAIAPALADGTYDVAVTATDALGNAGTDASANELTVDTTAPTVTVTSASTTDTTPALSGTVDDNAATISVVVDGNTYAATNHGDGTWTLADDAIAPALADGTYDVAVTATDALGNAGTDASSNELTVDTTAPTVTVEPAALPGDAVDPALLVLALTAPESDGPKTDSLSPAPAQAPDPSASGGEAPRETAGVELGVNRGGGVGGAAGGPAPIELDDALIVTLSEDAKTEPPRGGRGPVTEPTKFVDLRDPRVAPIDPLVPDPTEPDQPMSNPSFLDGLDEMREALDAAQRSERVSVQALAGVSLSLSVGVVSWILRAGSLMVSFLSVVPLWRGFDPLPILGGRTRRSRRSEDEPGVPPPTDDASVETFFDPQSAGR